MTFDKVINVCLRKIALNKKRFLWCSALIYFFYYILPAYYNYTSEESKFLFHSSNCSIPDLEPLNDHSLTKYFRRLPYRECGNEKLTFIRKVNNTPFLCIDPTVVHKYSPYDVYCCYYTIVRIHENRAEFNRTCREFKNETAVQGDFLYVHCYCKKTRKIVYENIHTWVIVKKEVEENWKKIPSNVQPYSVLIVAIDSVSRLNLIRSLPKTYEFLTKNGWISMDVYNKVGDNTFPNAMAFLTGFNESYALSICKPSKISGLDNCPLLIYKFRDLGYATAYAEDEPSISTFNCGKVGFTEPPTHYYFRPYFQISGWLKNVVLDGLNYCTGPETTGERVMNIAKEFAITMKGRPSFGLFWMNSFSHNTLNLVSKMDGKIERFLASLKDNDVLENSVVIFLSDHGSRGTDYSQTRAGWFENRLPFIFFSIPERFKKDHPSEIANLEGARFKLTNPYDVYMTLQHILVLSGLNHTISPSTSCPNCKSLFTYIPYERSCEEISIDKYYCTCLKFHNVVDLTDSTLREASNLAVNTINSFTKGIDKCRIYELVSVESVKVSKDSGIYSMMIIIKTKPMAVFEALVVFDPKKGEEETNFKIEGRITRLDRYSPHSECAADPVLKQYCYCKGGLP